MQRANLAPGPRIEIGGRIERPAIHAPEGRTIAADAGDLSQRFARAGKPSLGHIPRRIGAREKMRSVKRIIRGHVSIPIMLGQFPASNRGTSDLSQKLMGPVSVIEIKRAKI